MSRVPREIRDKVRQRANLRCEYCLKPEGYSLQSYHVEHIRSKKHKGSDEPDNLAWACFQCNLNKGTDIAAFDEYTKQYVPFYNPRTQKWNEHFYMNGAHIIAKTPSARVTIQILQLNHEDQIETRYLLIEAGLF